MKNANEKRQMTEKMTVKLGSRMLFMLNTNIFDFVFNTSKSSVLSKWTNWY